MGSRDRHITIQTPQESMTYPAACASSGIRTGLNSEHSSWIQECPISSSPSPVLHRRSLSPVSPPSNKSPLTPLSCKFPQVSGEMEADLPPNREPSPWAESCRDSSDEGAACGGQSSPALRRHLVSTVPSPDQNPASARLQHFDPDKNSLFLLKELDALRALNNKLQEQLVQKEKELLEKEVDDELKEEERNVRCWERSASVLEEVLVAQKDRDRALMSRLLLANEERDEALRRARRLQEAAEYDRLEAVDLQDTDMDVEKLLQGVCEADNVQEVERFGAHLIHHLRMSQQRRNSITAQEMKAVLEDRDKSVIKCKRLEEDLLQQRHQWMTQEEMLMLQRERGGALEDRRQLDAEIQELRVDRSSPLSVPNEAPSLPPDSVSQKPLASQDQNLQVRLQQLSREKQSVEEELRRSQEAEREASEKVRRLERLVDVLRKKVGTGSLRVI
ncbi:mirror-image polydactyly gene 1 protein [Nematolebias whitei]|uniref:mirror-image polydactyly gene 1 protein n=1 Tax=Nematolebias whitei TaxID=451745 RepID=UPI00189BDB8B|nr:mirror-image polydactyly gene 1 protein [Nematolebias whitei]